MNHLLPSGKLWGQNHWEECTYERVDKEGKVFETVSRMYDKSTGLLYLKDPPALSRFKAAVVILTSVPLFPIRLTFPILRLLPMLAHYTGKCLQTRSWTPLNTYAKECEHSLELVARVPKNATLYTASAFLMLADPNNGRKAAGYYEMQLEPTPIVHGVQWWALREKFEFPSGLGWHFSVCFVPVESYDGEKIRKTFEFYGIEKERRTTNITFKAVPPNLFDRFSTSMLNEFTCTRSMSGLESFLRAAALTVISPFYIALSIAYNAVRLVPMTGYIAFGLLYEWASGSQLYKEDRPFDVADIEYQIYLSVCNAQRALFYGGVFWMSVMWAPFDSSQGWKRVASVERGWNRDQEGSKFEGSGAPSALGNTSFYFVDWVV